MKGLPVSQLTNNNFNLLRLVAAVFVIISHSFGLLNKGLQQPALYYAGKHLILSDVGLYIFFTISGYLVTNSLFESNSLTQFLVKRALRILPALLIVNVCCIILGAFITTLTIQQYLSSTVTYKYFLYNSTFIHNQFTLPGVFTSLTDQSVNASIWTITIEVVFYLSLFIGANFIITKKWLYLSLFIVAQCIRFYLVETGSNVLHYFDLDVYFTYGSYFYLGSLFYLFQNKIKLRWMYANVLMALALISVYTFLQPLTEALFFVYIILLIGKSKALVNNKGNDISYGLYLYAFPVQQVVVLYFGPDINPWIHIILSTIIAVVPAYLSWRVIEKLALRWKNKSFFTTNQAKL